MIELFSQPHAWAALGALVTLEVVLGIDNLIFISIASSRLPPAEQAVARRIGIALALLMRLLLLTTIAWIVGLTRPVFDLGISGAIGPGGAPSFETAFSWRDMILIAGGLFLVWKSVTEIHAKVDPQPVRTMFRARRSCPGFATVVGQIILLDIVFSFDSILTAVGMTDELPIMIIAVVIAVATMAFLATPVANFINRNPTIVMMALAFLLMIGTVLIAEGFGRHVPKGYIYAAILFAAFIEGLNMLARRRALRRTPVPDSQPGA